MIFGSMSHRDQYEAPKIEKMNHSQMSHQSGNVMRIPPVQIQNLNRPAANNGNGANGTNSSSGENQSMPPSDSDKILDLNVQSLIIQPSNIPYQNRNQFDTIATNVKTPEPRNVLPQEHSNSASTSNSSSIYKTLHMHKRLPAGIGLRFNKSAQQCRNDAINEAEEYQDVTNKEDSDASEEDADSNEDDSEDPEDSR